MSVQSMPVIDGLLAATALEHGLTVVTRNVDDFRCSGAAVVNPFL
jgi:predicted nucleic acid-binding protein